jgi:hypothetical protein
MPSSQVSWDLNAFDELLQSQGVQLIHYQAIPCPVGLISLDDDRRPHPDHSGCTNGFLYSEAGKITALFIGNGKNKTPDDMGFWDGSSVQATFPRFYDECCEKPFLVCPYDRFYLDEKSITVVTWQRFIHHESGADKLKFPVEQVLKLVGNDGKEYRIDEDFVVCDGQLKWVGDQPAPTIGLDGPIQDRGAVCAVRYTYRPWWYVGRLMHELRVSQVSGPEGRSIHRLPQNCLLHREYVAQSKDQPDLGGPSPADSDTFRTVMGPMYGGFGPR